MPEKTLLVNYFVVIIYMSTGNFGNLFRINSSNSQHNGVEGRPARFPDMVNDPGRRSASYGNVGGSTVKGSFIALRKHVQRRTQHQGTRATLCGKKVGNPVTMAKVGSCDQSTRVYFRSTMGGFLPKPRYANIQ